MSRVVYVNGRYRPYRDALVHAEDRGYQFGDGVYEVCEVYSGRLVDERRHMLRLHETRGRMAEGKNLEGALMSLRPPVFFKFKTRFVGQVNKWTEPLLARALDVLNDAEMAAKSTDMPADAVIERALIQLANVARSSRR